MKNNKNQNLLRKLPGVDYLLELIKNDIRFNKKDHFNKTMVKVEDTNNLIELIMAKKFKTCYISTHPERWSDNFVEWWYNLIWQEIKNTGKIILR